MALMTIRLDREKTLGSVVKRVFEIEGRGAARRRKEAERAVLEANPGLARREGFKPGTTVVVPQLPGLRLRERPMREAPRKAAPDPGAVATYAAGQLRRAQAAVSQIAAEADQKAEEELAWLKDRDFQKLVRAALPDKAELVRKATEGVPKRQAARKEKAEQFGSALDRAAVALEALSKRAKVPPRD